MYNNLDAKMTRDRYLEMCEQLGKEPDPERIPPDWNYFPESGQYIWVTRRQSIS